MQFVAVRQNSLAGEIGSLSGIRSRVIAHIHSFICETYYKLAFSGAAESIFEQHQVAIDNLLSVSAPEVLEKIPSISDRLAAGDVEAISHAMSSCRRMIDALADAVYPPSDKPENIGGHEIPVTKDKYLNRIYVALWKRCASESRRKRLNQSLHRINEKASSGTHDDISAGEARALFLSTYLVLGEILEATTQTKPAVPLPETPKDMESR